MNTEELLCCLKVVSCNVENAYVIARDQVKTINFKKLPIIVGMNTDTSKEKGQHWIGLYIYNSSKGICIDYFDSYGFHIDKYKIKLPYLICHLNARQLQCDESNVCGLYVLYFAYKRTRGCSLSNIYSRFATNCRINDRLVSTFFRRIRYIRSRTRRRSQVCCIKSQFILKS